jgi:hypothetical protein
MNRNIEYDKYIEEWNPKAYMNMYRYSMSDSGIPMNKE